MAQFRAKVAYGLSDALISVAPAPIQALRAPTGADKGYQLGTIWINKAVSPAVAYILVSIIANVATWSLLEASGGAGVFTTLTSTGQTNLATTGASTNSFGNLSGNTSVDIFVGTGGFGVDGVGSATFDIGPSLTTGAINIGGTAQTGTITIASGVPNIIVIGSAGSSVNLLGLTTIDSLTVTGDAIISSTGPTITTIGNITGATSVDISVGTAGFGLDGVGASTYDIGSSTTTGTITIGGSLQGGAITLGESSATNIVNVGTGIGLGTINIGTGVGAAKTINIGIGTGIANTIVVGGTGANNIGIGAVQAGGLISIGDSMTTGSINIGGATQIGAIFIGASSASQTISIGNGATNPKTILIGTSGSSANLITMGSVSGAASTEIRAGTAGIYLNAPFVELPGPIFMYTGAGTPGNGLALHAGDVYINTTPTMATDRMFIATGAGAWTNVTCAA